MFDILQKKKKEKGKKKKKKFGLKFFKQKSYLKNFYGKTKYT